jgi:hypothetical protein
MSYVTVVIGESLGEGVLLPVNGEKEAVSAVSPVF